MSTGSPARLQAASGRRWMALPLIAGGLGVLARLWPPLAIGHDCGWYLYVGERLLDGERLYEDVVVNNPPLIVYLNVLVVAVGRALGQAPLLAWHGAVLAVVALGLVLSARVLRQWPTAADVRPRAAILAGLAWLWIGLPGYDYGQREHLLCVLATPYVLLAGVRRAVGPVPMGTALMVGVAAAVGCVLKPYYLLLPLLVQGAMWLSPPGRRRWRVLVSAENVGFALVVVAYAAWFAMMPARTWEGMRRAVSLALRTYAAYEQPLAVLLSDPRLLLALAIGGLGALALVRDRGARPLLVPVLLAWLAVVVAALWQRKGWPYHLLPGLTFGGLLLALLLVRRWPTRQVCAALALVSIVAAAATAIDAASGAAARRSGRATAAALRGLAPNGTVLVLDTDISPHFPTINYAGLRWCSRFPCLWPLPSVYAGVPATAQPFPYATSGERAAIEREFAASLAEDVQRRPPSLVIVHKAPLQAIAAPTFDLVVWLRRHPELERFWRQFELFTESDVLAFYRRRP